MNTVAPLRCDRAPAWGKLQAHFDAVGRDFDLRTAFAADVRRLQRFSQQAPYLYADLSKNLIDTRAEELLLELAVQCGLEAQRDAMFAGAQVNRSEGRAALHVLLRDPQTPPGLQAQAAQVHATRKAMLAFAESVRADAGITDVVNIGIGGSDLGAHMAVLALDEFVLAGKRFHFVANVDGHELASVLRRLRPQNTLFIIASKTFSTAETMTNANAARRWFEHNSGGPSGDPHSHDLPAGAHGTARHFVAVTANAAAAHAFGIETIFDFWDWVGGRYSMWSAIGLPIAIAIGAHGFQALLAGAHAMDLHFRTAPLARNLPVRLALLDIWYRNFHRFSSRCIAPYHSALRRLPAYLQQLEMESNGKRVDQSGALLPPGLDTAPVLWGEPGTNGQHAYFQMLHQGTQRVPVEFIAVREAAHALPSHHEKLLANALGQAQALMLGRPDTRGHRDFPGNRPSTFFVWQRLKPETLGAFIALYEHRVFTSGALWGIDSFDQWGVELGKALAQTLEPRLASGDMQGLDASTAGLLRRLREH
ncbi:MAG: glucose-6-phosphate isomerase [Burkholderiaceae bacterium]|jgi:glucose-6-phosphate isomerase|nr:glucose-6-phosphate isomerase [Burkholderiaceae bacterium]